MVEEDCKSRMNIEALEVALLISLIIFSVIAVESESLIRAVFGLLGFYIHSRFTVFFHHKNIVST